jgi:hypothetical protein
MFGVHMLTGRNPIFEPAMFRDRNFVTGLLFMAVTGIMLLAGLASATASASGPVRIFRPAVGLS